MEYVDKEIVTDNEYIPVVNTQPTIRKPFLIDNITINKTFYNLEDEKNNQENSIIEYQGTYMQNTGVDYKYNEVFDIVSILDGTVIEVTDNDVLGKTIKIRHNNDLISTYQSLSEVSVKVDDTVLNGQVIGKSGTFSLYSKDYNLHFELSYQGKNIDPEKTYNKTEDEL
jgi:stage II sporulation protein Q